MDFKGLRLSCANQLFRLMHPKVSKQEAENRLYVVMMETKCITCKLPESELVSPWASIAARCTLAGERWKGREGQSESQSLGNSSNFLFKINGHLYGCQLRLGASE